jgi:hypothetical protein
MQIPRKKSTQNSKGTRKHANILLPVISINTGRFIFKLCQLFSTRGFKKEHSAAQNPGSIQFSDSSKISSVLLV